MKKILFLAIMVFGMIACGGNTEKQTEEASAEQEAEAVEGITSDLDAAQQELQFETEEGLNEIDSLLQSVE